MLYVSQHQDLVRLGHQDAGGALLGFVEPEVGDVRCVGGEDGGYKGVRSMLLRDSFADCQNSDKYIDILQFLNTVASFPTIAQPSEALPYSQLDERQHEQTIYHN